jgi:uncharacterized protein
MKSLSELKEILLKNKEYLIQKYFIKEIGIFGSYARNEAKSNSDLDILVDFNRPIGLDFVLLADDLEEILKTKVDLVSVNAIQPKIFKYVKEELIYV